MIKTILENLANPKQITLSLYESHFDQYHHVNASAYIDMVSTAVLEATRPAGGTRGSAFHIQNLQIQYRLGIPLGTQSADVVLGLLAQNPDSLELGFSVRNGELEYASGKVKVSAKPLPALGETPKPQALEYGEPYIYQWDLPVLNNDRGPTFEMSPCRILENVFSSRQYALRGLHHTTIEEWLKNGFAVFLTQADIEFLHPIKKLGLIDYTSWCAQVPPAKDKLAIQFLVRDKETQTLYSQGLVWFTAIDVSQGKPRKTSTPDWAMDCLFKKK